MKHMNWEICDGKFSLYAEAIIIPDGICIYLGGGEQPHIGSVILSEPRQSLIRDGSRSCTSSLLNRIGHKDEVFARSLAEQLCVAIGVPVSVTAGIHIELATEQDIERLTFNFKVLAEKIVSSMSELFSGKTLN
ncbi:MAG: hypothetical protein GX022_05250 [Clostridiaceae bacterium]|nr:hypothetical protein [Clostridiaceae bacterium]